MAPSNQHPPTAQQILAEARERLARLPLRDQRSADEIPNEAIPGYDEHGLPR
jgi:hypothetical protein